MQKTRKGSMIVEPQLESCLCELRNRRFRTASVASGLAYKFSNDYPLATLAVPQFAAPLHGPSFFTLRQTATKRSS